MHVANERSRTVREQGVFVNTRAMLKFGELNANELKRTVVHELFANINERNTLLNSTVAAKHSRILVCGNTQAVASISN